MKFGNVYKPVQRGVLSTVIYPDCVDKDCWNGRMAGSVWRTGLLHAGLSDCNSFVLGNAISEGEISDFWNCEICYLEILAFLIWIWRNKSSAWDGR